MKLVLIRDQKKSLTGTAKFSLVAKADVTAEEQANIKKYKLGKTLLYTNMEDRGSGIKGLVSRALAGNEITVDDLVSGKKMEFKNIVDMLEYEEAITEVAKNFKAVLDASATFGGETVVEFE